jgi:uncharacterized protein
LLAVKKQLNWTFRSPQPLSTTGKRTGEFRLGTDQHLTTMEGKSWIYLADFAVALADEIEHLARIGWRSGLAIRE